MEEEATGNLLFGTMSKSPRKEKSSACTGGGSSDASTIASTRFCQFHRQFRWMLALIGSAICVGILLLSAPFHQALLAQPTAQTSTNKSNDNNSTVVRDHAQNPAKGPTTAPTATSAPTSKPTDSPTTSGATGTSRNLPKCARSYQTFQDGRPLHRGQFVIPHKDNTPHSCHLLAQIETADISRNLFVDERHKLAFCLIQKNACSTWSTCLHRLFHDDYNESHPDCFVDAESTEEFRVRHSNTAAGTATATTAEIALQAFLLGPTTTVAIFVRDPLARLVSGCRDKCFSRNCANPICCARAHHKIPNGQSVTFRQHVEWFLQLDLTHRPSCDGHWQLQSEHCGLQGHKHGNALLRRYHNFVALMTTETLATDATCWTELTKTTEHNQLWNATSGQFSGPFWESHARVKPLEHCQSQSEEDDLLRKRCARDMVEGVLQHVKQDCDIFQIPRPTWIESATGEWADHDFGGRQCEGRPSV